MMTYLNRIAGLTLLAVAVTACGGAVIDQTDSTQPAIGQPAQDDHVQTPTVVPDLGVCPGPGSRPQHAPGLDTLLDPRSASWMLVPAIDFIDAANAAEPAVDLLDLSFSQAVSLSETTLPSVVRIHTSSMTEAVASAESGADILIGYPAGWSDEYPPITSVLAADFGPGQVWFVGPCATDLYTTPFARAAGSGDGGIDSEFLRRSLTPGTPEAAAVIDLISRAEPPSPVHWTEVDPMLRSLDPSRTPASELVGLEPVDLLVSIPQTWSTGEGFICVRTAPGWHPLCIPTSVSVDADFVGQFAPLISSTGVTPVEIWLLGSLDYADSVRRLGVVQLDPSVTDLVTLVRLAADPDLGGGSLQSSVAEVDLIPVAEAAALREKSTDEAVAVSGP